MRYRVYDQNRYVIGDAQTAQKAGDMSKPGYVMVDQWGGNFPYVAWTSCPNGMGMIGHSFNSFDTAFSCARKG